MKPGKDIKRVSTEGDQNYTDILICQNYADHHVMIQYNK